MAKDALGEQARVGMWIGLGKALKHADYETS